MEWIDDWKNSSVNSKAKISINLKEILSRKSSSPLETLERHLKINMVYGIVFAIIYIGLGIAFPHWTIITFASVATLFTVYTTMGGYKLYISIKNWNSNQGLLPELKNIIGTFQSWLSITEKIAVFVYPFAISGGFIMGGAFSLNKGVDELFASNYTIIALLLCIVILTPASFMLTRILNKKAFGDYLDRLNELVNDIEKE